MLARTHLPQTFAEWNAAWGAPFGIGREHLAPRVRGLDCRVDPEGLLRRHGPFILQPSSSTRRYEYPWAHHHVLAHPGERVIEVGGGLSGLQFVLSRVGRHVINLDPGGGAGFELDADLVPLANEILGTQVELRRCTLAQASLSTGSVDVVMCLSTLEHLDLDQVAEVLVETRRILRPGGVLVLSIDLFLNVEPFSARASNRFGTNHVIWPLLEDCGFDVTWGAPDEVLGGPSFSVTSVLERLDEVLVSDTYPVLAQLLVAAPKA
jgi:SAM-dependent methyltransferase